MILSYNELVLLVGRGVIQGVEPKQINAASIDVRLGPEFLFEKASSRPVSVDLGQREALRLEKKTYSTGSAPFLEPGEFCLAHTLEVFNLPDDISAEFKLKSSIARSGLNQLTAVWCDAGWNNSALTLELSNVTRFHRLKLQVGMAIGQMVFHHHAKVPHEQSYAVRGRYNNDRTVSGVKQ